MSVTREELDRIGERGANKITRAIERILKENSNVAFSMTELIGLIDTSLPRTERDFFKHIINGNYGSVIIYSCIRYLVEVEKKAEWKMIDYMPHVILNPAGIRR
ncbi:MAG: hypothetical protein HZB92_06490 [Euryarchaeota archaeon]|nr:hypothetical protein [Euryarchaeota archaeon]